MILLASATLLLAAALALEAWSGPGAARQARRVWTGVAALVLALPALRWAADLRGAGWSLPGEGGAQSPPGMLLVLWVAGASVSLLWLAARWWQLRRLLGRGRPLDAAEAAAARAACPDVPAAALRIHAGPQPLPGPLVAGFAAPRIWLPQEFFALPPASQRLLLRHEAEHWRRGDSRWLLAVEMLRCLLWWHPLAICFARRFPAVLESACDAAVLRHGAEASSYARCLVETAAAASCAASPGLALAASSPKRPSELRRRVQAILQAAPAQSWGPWAYAVGAALLLLAAAGALLRPASSPALLKEAALRLEADPFPGPD